MSYIPPYAPSTQDWMRQVSSTLNPLLGRLGNIVYVDAVGDYDTALGTGTDDSEAFAKAIAALGTGGGVVKVPAGLKCLIDADLNVPDNVVIEGDGNGRRGDYNNAEANLLGWSPTLYVNPTATISLNTSSGIRNLAIFRKGLAFNITSAQVASDFTGTAITLADFACDPVIEGCTILGFEYAIRTVPSNSRANRVRIRWNNIDCINGILLENAADLSYLHDNEGWPFVTVGSAAEANSAQLLRSGTFVHLGGTINDWTAAVDHFCYGYAIGYRATDQVQSVSFINCRADHVPSLTDGARGFLVDGTAREIRIINPQVAAKQRGIYIDSTYGSGRIAAVIENPMVWAATSTAILCNQGDVLITGGSLRGTGGGVGVQTATGSGRVNVNGTDFRGLALGLSNFSVSTRLQYSQCAFTSVATIVGNPYVPTAVSAATLVLDGENDVFIVSGTTNISAISPAVAYTGRRVTLRFGGSLTVTNGASLKLAGGVDFAATADDTLSLISDSTTWREVSRSVN